MENILKVRLGSFQLLVQKCENPPKASDGLREFVASGRKLPRVTVQLMSGGAVWCYCADGKVGQGVYPTAEAARHAGLSRGVPPRVREVMTQGQRNAAIRALIERRTKADTVDRETARRALIAEGIYTEAGELASEYGGSSSRPS